MLLIYHEFNPMTTATLFARVQEYPVGIITYNILTHEFRVYTEVTS